MIYFKKVAFNMEDKAGLESALRKFSSKRHTSLDFKSSISNIGEDKFFLGYEGKKDLKFMRIRTSLERYLPELIISFPTTTDNLFYKFRLSVISTLIFCMLSVGIIVGIISLFIAGANSGALFFPGLVMILFITLTFLELSIVQSKIKKAVSKYNQLTQPGN